jgi:hypothetical protein
VNGGDPQNPDPLDDLLAVARWPDMPADASQRLRHQWSEITKRRPSATGWRKMSIAAAAVILLLAGVWVSIPVRHDVSSPPRTVVMKTVSVVARAALVPSRPANPAELAVALTAANLAPEPAITTVADTSSTHRPETLETLLRRDSAAGVDRCLRMTENGHDREAVAALKSVRGPAVDRLFARLDDPKVAVRLAAARLLGKVDGPAVTERLAEMVGENRNRREALAALMQSDGPEARQFVARAQGTRNLEAVVRSIAVQLKSF